MKAIPERSSPAKLGGELHHDDELYDLAPVSFLTLDRSGKILGLNRTSAVLLGFPTQWLRGRPFVVFVARRDVQRFLSLLTHIRGTPDQHEILNIELSISARTVPVQLSIKPGLADGHLVYRMAVVELTETKAIERELKATLANWYSLVESAPDIIMTVDRKGKITFVNRRVWEHAARVMVGTRIMDYVSEKDRSRLEKCIAAVFNSDRPATCEISGINGDKERWYSFSFGPVHGASELDDTTTTVTIREVTQRKRTEQSLRASREQLREFAGRLEQVREDERTRVAREIHDELGQALTIMKMDLSWLQGKTRSDNSEARKKIKSMIADVDQTIDHVRKIVSELRPSILDEMGLVAALEWQVAQFQARTGIQGIFESKSENVDLRPDAAAALFRVVQEALTNIVRHANARQVRVALTSAGGVLRIAITDDGKGLTRLHIKDRKSFGIVGMRERVHRIGGQFNIYSSPGRGTRIEISTLPQKND